MTTPRDHRPTNNTRNHTTNTSTNFLNNNSSLVAHQQQPSANEKYSEEEYSNYIDSSEVVIQTYKNSSANGLERYFLDIESWLDKPLASDEENLPFVIEADEGVGKKTLLVKWMEYHETKKKKQYPDIILSHFASTGGNNANYFFAIYRILNRLREALDIQQKVELLEEKLRKYFSYWLNHCSDKLEKELKFGEKVNYGKVIIIIEGIDLFIDQQYNKEANVSFWLPKYFPQHIKLIVTCDKSSKANAYFRSLNCDLLKIPVEFNIVSVMMERHSARELFISEATRVKHLAILHGFDQKFQNQQFYKIFLCTLLPYPTAGIIGKGDIDEATFERYFSELDYEKLRKVQDSSQLIEFLVEFYASQIMDRERFFKLLRLFTLTQKGLTLEEIMHITGVTLSEWQMFLASFKVFVLGFKGLWIMNNDAMKRVIHEKFKCDANEVRELHTEIAVTLGKLTANSIRKLEEQTYHLFMGKDYFKLKEIISAIENFLLLFNPNNKYDLCRYWQILEEQGFDPVVEYNKAIEGFEMHYHPTSQDVFRIIVQISRFLKEFSDFETYFTPEFRHPPVKGTYDELDDIGLLRELLGLEIFKPTEAEENETPDLEKYARNPEEKIAERKEKLKSKNKKESTLKKKKNNNGDDDTNRYSQNSYNNAASKKKSSQNSPREKQAVKKHSILSKIEALNVDIPSSREQFRLFYENQLKEIIKTNSINQNQDTADSNQKNLGDSDDADEHTDATDDEEDNNSRINRNQSQNNMADFDNDDDSKIRSDHKNTLTSKSEKRRKRRNNNNKSNGGELITMNQLREAHDLKERLPTNYYYKRWLWVQFPWACLSLKCDYSAKLKECFSSPIEYMSVKKEKEFTKQALKIAIEAKLKKQLMYKKQPNNNSLSDSQSIIQPIGGPYGLTGGVDASTAGKLNSINATAIIDHSILGTKQLSNSNSNSNNQTKSTSQLLPALHDPLNKSKSVLNLPGVGGNTPNTTTNDRYNGMHSHNNSKSSSFNLNKQATDPFFITNQYLSQNTLNKEIDFINKKKSMNSKSSHEKSSVNQNLAAVLKQQQQSGQSNFLLTQPVNVENTSKVLEKGRVFKDKSRFFDPISSIQDSQNISTVLPRLKGSIVVHSKKELSLLETQALDMKREFDHLVHTNRNLARQLKEIKVSEHIQNKYSTNPEKVESAQEKIVELEKNIEETHENYLHGLMQIDRLKSILKICEDNKQQNEDWIRNLNFLLSNFRKMIRVEQEDIKSIRAETGQLTKINKEYGAVIEDKLDAQRTLIAQINHSIKSKERFDYKFNRIDKAIEQSAIYKIETMKSDLIEQETRKKQRDRQVQLERNSKQVQELLEKANAQFTKLKNVIDISDPDYAHSEKLQKFLSSREKHNDLRCIVIQREEVVNQLSDKLRDRQEYLETVKKAFASTIGTLASPSQIASPKAEAKQVVISDATLEPKSAAATTVGATAATAATANTAATITGLAQQQQQQQQPVADNKQNTPDTAAAASAGATAQKAATNVNGTGNATNKQQVIAEVQQNSTNVSSTQSENGEPMDVNAEQMLIHQLQNELESKQRIYAKRQNIRLATSMKIATLQRKLDIEQGTDVRTTIDFQEDSIIANLEEKMNVIKQKSEEEDFKVFLAGNYDFAKVYRKLVKNIGMPDFDQDNSLENRDV